MADATPRGRFVWYDLMTTDPKGAQKFYTELVGWDAEEWDAPPEVREQMKETYVMWKNGDDMLGGVSQLPKEAQQMGAPPHWLPYVAVDDVDSTAQKAKQHGAQVHVPPQDIPTVGRFAVMQDPQGGVFAAFKAAEKWPGHDGPANKGEFSWHEFMATDWEKAWDFYRSLFGWEETGEFDMGPEMGGMYQMYGRNGQPLGGMFTKPPEMPGPASWLLYIHVPDVDAAAERVKQLGGQVVNGPMEVPGGDKIVQCTDPQGAFFALHASKKD